MSGAKPSNGLRCSRQLREHFGSGEQQVSVVSPLLAIDPPNWCALATGELPRPHRCATTEAVEVARSISQKAPVRRISALEAPFNYSRRSRVGCAGRCRMRIAPGLRAESEKFGSVLNFVPLFCMRLVTSPRNGARLREAKKLTSLHGRSNHAE